MKETVAIILAAGRGTRMISDVPKVLHEILGKPIICHMLDSVKKAGVKKVITVAGYGSKALRESVFGTKIVIQKELLGSGDAVMAAKKEFLKYAGDILILCGDTPLIPHKVIEELINKHKSTGASATLMTAHVMDPTSYGRIVRDDGGRIVKIVEEVEARLYEEVINEINVGTYCFRARDLFDALSSITPDNKKKEYFLTDVVSIMRKKGKLIESVLAKDPDCIVGVNNRVDLAKATKAIKTRILENFMLNGVTIEDPSSTTIYPRVRIGRDTIIHPNTLIESDVEIGDNCRIGPFTRIRPNVRIGDNVEVGNFVELVRAYIKNNTRVKHHTYLGDALVGANVNIGAGTITANYDGKNKNRTVIEDGAFIGVGSILIAPVRIGKNAVVGAGCVVPKGRNVPKGATVVGVPARIFKREVKR